ncbi:MAG: GyrI-like domain-containing protein [Promethearchaeota archaeon]
MVTIKKIDYKKQFPKLYKPSAKEPSILMIPEMNFFMVDGKGDPNTAQEYQDAIETLYSVSYALKMKIIKKQTPDKDYVVPPLEGLWHIPKMENWSMDGKEMWEWTMMMRIPDFVIEPNIKKAMKILKETKNPVSLPKLRYEKYNEGLVLQIMYFGPYDDEPPIIAKLHKFAEDNGYILDGKHHEIYLNDPRRTKPERLKTVLRQSIKNV